MFKIGPLAFAFAMIAANPITYAAANIINLSASPTNANAGKDSSGYAYNPVDLSMAAGTYTVRVVGTADGGLYNGFAVYAPTATNAAWTDGKWSVSFNGGLSAAYTQADIGGTVADFDSVFKPGRYNSVSAALAVYSAATAYTFTLANAQNVDFYANDSFGDDTGGISLAVTPVPEPATIALVLVGLIGIACVTWKRRRSTV